MFVNSGVSMNGKIQCVGFPSEAYQYENGKGAGWFTVKQKHYRSGIVDKIPEFTEWLSANHVDMIRLSDDYDCLTSAKILGVDLPQSWTDNCLTTAEFIIGNVKFARKSTDGHGADWFVVTIDEPTQDQIEKIIQFDYSTIDHYTSMPTFWCDIDL